MSTVVAIVKSIVGQVTATSAEGAHRVLIEGDRLYVGDTLDTGAGGMVTLELADGRSLDLGRATQWSSADVAGENTEAPTQSATDAQAEVLDVQRAIAAGADPTQDLAPTAAGPGAGGAGGAAGGSHSFVLLSETGGAVQPDIGIAFTDAAGGDAVVQEQAIGTEQNLPPVFTGADGNDATATFNVTTDEDTAYNGTFTARDNNGDALTYAVVGGGTTHGSLTLTPQGVWTYTPAANYNGPDSFQVVVTDGRGASDTLIVNIGVTPVNDAPVANDATGSAVEDASVVSGTLTASDVDTGDTQTFTLQNPATAPAGFSLNNNGTWSLDPSNAAYQSLNAGQQLTLDVPFTVTDSGGLTSNGVLTLTVTGVNDAPTVSGTVAVTQTEDDGAVLVDLLSNASDADTGDTLSVTDIAQSGSGDASGVTVNADGTLSLNTNAYNYLAVGESVTLTYTYNVIDQHGGSTPASATLTINGVNDAPVVSAVIDATTSQNAPAYTLDLLQNASDVDVSDALSVIDLQETSGGDTRGVTVNLDGTLSVDPSQYTYLAAGEQLALTYTYNVTDSNGGVTATSATVTITGTNDAPVAVADVASGSEDTPIKGNVLGNDTDVDNGAALSVTQYSVKFGDFTLEATVGKPLVTGVGILNIAANGDFTFTPAPNYNGPVPTVTYTVSDGTATSTATLNITVTPVNDAPFLVAPTTVQVTNEDTSKVFSAIRGNSIVTGDIDNGNLTTTLNVEHGTLNLGLSLGLSVTGNGTGTVVITGNQAAINLALQGLTYKPTADYNGLDNLNITSKDGTATTTTNVAIRVDAVADIRADNVSLNEDSALTFNAITGAGGGSADNFENPGRAVTGVTHGAHGSVSFNANGTLVYTPDANYNGPDSFTYTVTSGGVTETATVTVNVISVNDAAVLSKGDVTLSETNAVLTTNGQLTISDIDSPETFNAQPATVGQYGTFSINANGAWNFVANSAFNELSQGQNISETFTVTSADGTPTTVKVTIVGTNDAPVAVADVVSGNEDSVITGNVINNDSDVDSSALSITQYSVNFGPISLVATVGKPLVTGAGILNIAANGDFTFTPAPNYNGPVPTVTYTVSDGTATSTATLNITVTPVNDAPFVIAPTTVQVTNEDTSKVFSGGNSIVTGDIDSANLTTTLSVGHGTLNLSMNSFVSKALGLTVTGSNSGTLVITGNQAAINLALQGLTYKPTADYNGLDNLNITSKDGTATSTTNVAIRVDAVADISADNVSVNEDNALSFNAITGAGGGSADTFENPDRAVTGVTHGAHGSVSFNANGTLTYTPVANYSGPDSFTYTVTSGGVTETATVTVNVNAVNDAPTSQPVAVQTLEDTPVNGSVTGADVDGDMLTYTLKNNVQPGHGTVVVNADGTFTYTPQADYNGPDSFIVTVSDGKGGTVDTVVSVGVTPVADAPTVVISTDGNNDGIISTTELAGSSNVTVTITVPAGTAVGDVLNITNPDGTVTTRELVAADLTNGVTLSYPRPADGVEIKVSATLTDAGGHTSSANEDSATVGDTTAPNAPAVVIVDDADDNNQLTAAEVGSNGVQVNVAVNGADLAAGGSVSLNISNGSDTQTVNLALSNGVLVIAGTTTPATGFSYSNGTISFTESKPATGDSISVTATQTDAAGNTSAPGSDSAEMVNTNPDAIDDPAGAAYTVSQNGTLNIVNGSTDLTANDTDADQDTLLVTRVNDTPVGNGAITLDSGALVTTNADGSFSYNTNGKFDSLAAGQKATDTFTYTISDGHGGTDTATATVTITGTNDAPTVSGPLTASGSEDGSNVVVDLLSGAGDVDSGAVLSVSNVSTLPAGVSLSGNTLTVNPKDDAFQALAAGATQNIVVTYNVTDEKGAVVTQTATITVTGTNDVPVVTSSAAATSGNVTEAGLTSAGAATVGAASTGGTLTASDVDTGSSTSWSVADGAGTYGSLTMTPAGVWTYNLDNTKPATQALAAGESQTESFTATVSDGLGGTAVKVITVTVNGTNDAPVVSSDAAAATGSVVEAGVLANGSATPGSAMATGTLTATDVDHNSATTWSVQDGAGTYGSLTLSPAGVWTYTLDNTKPATQALAAGESKTDTFLATVSDGLGGTAVQQITVTVNGTNDNPVAVDDHYVLGLTGQYFGYAEVNGANLTSISQVESLIAGKTPNATFTATALNYGNGVSSDLGAGTNLQTFLGNDKASLSADPVTTSDAIIKLSGQVSLDAGTYSFKVTSDDGFILRIDGQDVIKFDGNRSANDNTANYTIPTSGAHQIEIIYWDQGGNAVLKVETKLASAPDSAYTVLGASGNTGSLVTAEDTALTINASTLLKNDSDADGGTLSVINVPSATHGSVSLLDGVITFIPDANYHGEATFQYTVSDGKGGTATANVTLLVTQVNDAPTVTATPVALSGDEDQLGGIVITSAQLLGNASDVDGNTLSVQNLSATPGSGTLTNNNNGTWTFVPTKDWNGDVKFSYTVSDGSTGVADSAVLSVKPVTDIKADTATINEDGAITLNVLSNDSFSNADKTITAINGQPITSAGVAVENGTVKLVNGQLQFTATADHSGQSNFTYTVKSGGVTETGDVKVVINPVNDATPPTVTVTPKGYWTFDATTTTGNGNKAITTVSNGITGETGTLKDNDSTGNSANPALSTGTGTGTRADGAGTYLNLNSGSDIGDVVQLDTSITNVLLTSATLTFWIKTAQAGGANGNGNSWSNPSIIGSEQVSGGNDIQWGAINSSGQIGFGLGNVKGVYSQTSINDSQWHNIAISRDANTGLVNVYVDGKLEGTGSPTDSAFTGALNQLVQIGATNAFNGNGTDAKDSAYFKGALDDLRIYSGVLSADQVAAIHHVENGYQGTAIANATTSQDKTLTFSVTDTAGKLTVTGLENGMTLIDGHGHTFTSSGIDSVGDLSDWNTSNLVLSNTGTSSGTLIFTGTNTVSNGDTATTYQAITLANGTSVLATGTAAADSLDGSSAADLLRGGNGNDTLKGFDGNDRLEGGAGNDSLYGGAGNDILIGGGGDDLLFGGSGNNIMTGGAGADTFTWQAGDVGNSTITDFKASEGDRIDLSDLLPDMSSVNVLDYLKVDTATSTIQVSTTGHIDQGANVSITLQGVDLNTYGSSSGDIIKSLVAGTDPVVKTDHH